mgnify:CR=1 FL=1
MPRRRGKPMPSYFASKEEMEACLFCRRNNIRISPMGIQNDLDHWKITINIGPYKKRTKVKKPLKLFKIFFLRIDLIGMIV